MPETAEFKIRRDRVLEAMTSRALNGEKVDPKVSVTVIEYGKNGAVTRGTVRDFALRTYLGVPAYTWEVRERGASGLRTQYIWWLAKARGQDTEWEAGTLTARTVRGNVHRGTYEVIMGTHDIVIEGLSLS